MLMEIYSVVVTFTFLINARLTIIFAGLSGCKTKTMSNAELHSNITLLFYLFVPGTFGVIITACKLSARA